MDGHFRQRSSPARGRHLSLEPLEDRFLLATALIPARGLPAPAVAAQPAAPALPAATGPSPQTGGDATPLVVASDPTPDYSPAAHSTTSSPVATTAGKAAEPPDRAETGTARHARSSYADALSDNSRPAADSSARRREYNDDRDDEDDENDAREARLQEEASESRSAAGASKPGPAGDSAASPARRAPAVDGGAEEEQEEAVPPQVAGTTSEVPAAGKLTSNAPRPEAADVADAPPTGLPAATTVGVRPPAPVPVAAPEGSTIFGLSFASVPAVGEVGLDVRAIEQGVDAFFARLSALNADGGGGGPTTGVACWLTAVAAAALEIARVRDKARRCSPASDGMGLPGGPHAEEGT